MKISPLPIRFFLPIICFLFSFSVFAQPTLKEQNRIKDFGKSLKKYEKKNSKETNKETSKDDETIRVETNLVVNDVLVVNQKGNLIAGLKKEDFIVTENGEDQEIGLFAFGEDAKVPRSIVLIIDYSTSLLPYIENSIDSAKLFIEKLSSNDRMAIVTDDVKLLVNFTKDKVLLKKTLDNLKKRTLKINGGKSRPFSALLSVLNELFNDEDIRPIIIFQTDGDEIPSLKQGIGEYPMSAKLRSTFQRGYGERAFSFADLTLAIGKSRATIYSIIPGLRLLGFSENEQIRRSKIMLKDLLKSFENFENDENKLNDFVNRHLSLSHEEYLVRQTAMFEVSKLSGGSTDFLEKPEDAETVYNTIFQTIANRYVVGYYPKNEAKDGKRRTVKIEVKNHPEYTIMGRKTYIAPLEEK